MISNATRMIQYAFMIFQRCPETGHLPLVSGHFVPFLLAEIPAKIRWHRSCCPETMQKTTVQQHSFVALILAAISAKFHSLMDAIAPVGYQDDSGFHMGVQRAAKK